MVPLCRRIHVTSFDSTSAVTNWRSSSDRWAIVTIAQRGLPSAVRSIAADVERRAVGPRRERRRGQQAVELAWRAPCGPSAGKNWSSSNTPSLRIGGCLHLADQRRQVERLALLPTRLDQVGQQDVLAARQRVGVDADQAEQARHVARRSRRATISTSLMSAGACSEPTMFSGTPAVEPGV